MTVNAAPTISETLPTDGFLALLYGIRIASASSAIILMLSDNPSPLKWALVIVTWSIFAVTLLVEARRSGLSTRTRKGSTLAGALSCAALVVAPCLTAWAMLGDYATQSEVAVMAAIQSGMIAGWLVIEPRVGRGSMTEVSRRVYVGAALVVALAALALSSMAAGSVLVALAVSLVAGSVLGWYFAASSRSEPDSIQPQT